jgi:26S proteasome regulatory subunit N3
VRDTPEFIVFNLLIVITRLIDNKKLLDVAHALSFLVSFLSKNESHTLHYLRARTYHYYTYVNEKLGTYSNIITDLHNAYRKACLDLDEVTQVTLINCIIRYYLLNVAYEQARNFISKTKYHENVSTNEDARYYFYLGTINAVQMNYSEAFVNLTNSLRKAPEKCAADFKSNVQKLLIIVELLMGEVPDIAKVITTAQNLKALKPYFDLIKSVKQGNLNDFKITLYKYEASFIKDKFYNLIQRLRHVVIKIGLRRINISYSRISLKDITEKLNLESEKDCEYIVAKVLSPNIRLSGTEYSLQKSTMKKGTFSLKTLRTSTPLSNLKSLSKEEFCF